MIFSIPDYKIMINKNAADRLQDSKSSMVLATDLSKAYDVINHTILLRKWKFHGVGKDSLALLTSFFGVRECFVDVQG